MKYVTMSLFVLFFMLCHFLSVLRCFIMTLSACYLNWTFQVKSQIYFIPLKLHLLHLRIVFFYELLFLYVRCWNIRVYRLRRAKKRCCCWWVLCKINMFNSTNTTFTVSVYIRVSVLQGSLTSVMIFITYISVIASVNVAWFQVRLLSFNSVTPQHTRCTFSITSHRNVNSKFPRL